MINRTKKKSSKRINLIDLLEKMGACPDAMDWAKGKTPKKAWETCDKPAWLRFAVSELIEIDFNTCTPEEPCLICKLNMKTTPSEIRKFISYRKLYEAAKKKGYI